MIRYLPQAHEAQKRLSRRFSYDATSSAYLASFVDFPLRLLAYLPVGFILFSLTEALLDFPDSVRIIQLI